MADDDLDPPVDEPQRQLSPVGLYSHAADVAQRFPQMKGTPQQYKAMLTKQGVKPDEFKHSGFDQKFSGRPMVSRDELARHFNASVPPVQETTLSGDKFPAMSDKPEAKFKNYTLPGGTNYRETLLHLPKDTTVRDKMRAIETRMNQIQNNFDMLHGQPDSAALAQQRAGLSRENEALYKELTGLHGQNDANYKSGHWDTPNVLAHLRMSDRKGPKGEKILHLEELQSDWAQEGRKHGFNNEEKFQKLIAERDATPQDSTRWDDLQQQIDEMGRSGHKGIPHAPYVDSTQKWVDLGLKRVLHEAAKGGYDKVAMTPGDEQAKRYDLSKHINDVTLHGAGDSMRLSATDHGGRKVIDMQHVTPATLPDFIGKEAAEKLLKQPEPNPKNPYAARNLFNADLKVGGEGMKAFYDKILPTALEKLAKKHDPEAQVGKTKLISHTKHPTNEMLDREAVGPDVHSLDITPKMRASILKGQPAYATGGAVPADHKAVVKKAVMQEAIEHGIAKMVPDPDGKSQFKVNGGHEYIYENLLNKRAGQHAKLHKAAGGSVDHDPSDAQKAAGNYAKERLNFQGLPISIENKAGSTRHGVDASGKSWSARLPADYGYVRGTEGADGDHVDCFVGPDRNSHLVVVVDQHDYRNKRQFDEHKCLLGYPSERAALRDYVGAFSDGHGHDRVGHVQSMSIDAFKKWLKSGKTTKAAASQSIVHHALQLARST